jgi:Transposase IS4
MSDLLANFLKIITPGEALCLDESLLKFHGRLKFKQCIRTKRARFGIKFFMLADCSTKFIISILPYQGKNTKLTASVKEFGSGGATVVTMLRDFYHHLRILVVDNYFNSPKLAMYLLKKGLRILGMLRK